MTTLADDIAAFISHGSASGWSEITVRLYQERLDLFTSFLRRRGCARAPEVTPEDLDAFMQEKLDEGRAKTSRLGLAILVRTLFRWLQDHGRIVTDPARGLPLPDDGEEDLPEPPLSESEVAAILAGLPRQSALDIRNACILEMLYGCGLRRGEVIRLDLVNVDLVQRTVWVEESKHGQSRLLPLMGSAATAVRDWLALRRSLVRGPDRGAFFLTRAGKRLTIQALAALFNSLNADRGPDARHLHCHLFRHSIAVHLLRGGADVRHIQAFLGHASISTVIVYLRMVPGRLKEAYNQSMPEIAVGAGP
jgi:site-specific recombinase XerD